MVVKKVNLCS